MSHIIHPKRHKSFSVAISALVSFLGLEALAAIAKLGQITLFWQVALLLYAFVIFWVIFVYDTHRRHLAETVVLWQEFWNYLILPSVVFWAPTVLIFLTPFNNTLNQAWVVFGAVGLAGGSWYLKSAFHSHKTVSPGTKQVIFLIKVLASFLSFAAILGASRYYELGPVWCGFATVLLAHLLVRQALFQHHHIRGEVMRQVVWISVVLGILSAILYTFWNVNFYSAAVMLAAAYNTAWGILHHHFIDRNLTKEIIYEYLSVLLVVLIILFSVTNFGEKV